MKKIIKYTAIIVLFIVLSSMAIHKFYVAIYQINYVPQKKMLQITTRIFVDDLNEALEHKFHKKTFLGDEKETPDDEVLMNKYIAEKFTLKINGQLKPFRFLSKELEDNVVVCYFSIKDLTKITSLEINNSIITEIHSEQQNMIQANIHGEKQSLLLTDEITKGMLK